MVDPLGREQEPEQAEDRARRTDPVSIVRRRGHRERHQRAAQGEHEVEDQEPPPPVHALHERAGEPQGVHVEQQVEWHDRQRGMDQGDRPQAPDLAVRHPDLVQGQQVAERVPVGACEVHDERDDRGERDQGDRERDPGLSARLREVAAGRSRSPSSFDSHPSRDAISALSTEGRTAVGLPVGRQRGPQVAGAHAGRRDVAPGRIVLNGVSGRRVASSHAAERLRVVVEPVRTLPPARAARPR